KGDFECAATAYCDFWELPTPAEYHCKPKKSQGQKCDANTVCANGNCVDGVCCENTCSGTCMSCKGTSTGSVDGLCKPVKVDTNPDFECSQLPQSTCGQNGVCDGVGACKLWPNGTVCSQQWCASGTSQNNKQTCNGTGTCSAPSTTGCLTGYACYTFNP